MSKLLTAIVIILLVVTATLSAASFYMFQEINAIKESSPYEVKGNIFFKNLAEKIGNESTSEAPPIEIENAKEEISYSFQDCANCEEEVSRLIDEAIEAIPTSAPTATATTSTTTAKTQTSYIPLGSTASSTSTDWYTVGDASSYIDLVNDFNSNAYVTWEASLKIKHGNGEARARLWDNTNKIAVDGSELVTSGNEDYEHKKSGRIYLWNGNNNYMIQIKSVGGYEVTVSDAKVKVVY